MSTATRKPTSTTYEASRETIDHLVALVVQARPSWDQQLVHVVLSDLARKVAGNDLAIAALRAASNTDLPQPKAIAWRGPHWVGLESDPPAGPLNPPRCGVCGHHEPRCYSVRHGDDDHTFEPVAR